MMRTDQAITPKTIFLKDYTPPAFKATEVDLRFELFDEKTIVTSKVQYVKNVDAKTNDLFLHGEDQKLSK